MGNREVRATATAARTSADHCCGEPSGWAAQSNSANRRPISPPSPTAAARSAGSAGVHCWRLCCSASDSVGIDVEDAVQFGHLDRTKHLVVVSDQADRRTGFLRFVVALEHGVQRRASEEVDRLQVDDDQPGRVCLGQLERGGQVSGDLIDGAGVDAALDAHNYRMLERLVSHRQQLQCLSQLVRMRSVRRSECLGTLTVCGLPRSRISLVTQRTRRISVRAPSAADDRTGFGARPSTPVQGCDLGEQLPWPAIAA